MKILNVYVPGMVCSQLEDSKGILWLDYSRILIGRGIDSLRRGEVSLAVTDTLQSYDSPIRRAMSKWPGDGLAFPYDFRETISIHSARLAEVLRVSAEGYDRVNIVAHSMGGLVSCGACHLLGQSWQDNLRLVTLGTPFLGSDYGIQSLFGEGGTMDSIVLANRIWLGINPATVLESDAAKSIVSDIVRTWPGLWDLIPPPLHVRDRLDWRRLSVDIFRKCRFAETTTTASSRT